MKGVAGGLLAVAAVLYVVTLHVGDGRGFWGYLRAAAEAGMVGGLADWFAVTALFRHPLGLRIPHTAIIPTRKDAIGNSLGDFVGANFLNETVVRSRIRSAEVSRRLGGWLSDPAHAGRVVAELAVAVAAAVGVLRDEDVQRLVGGALARRLEQVALGPALGRLLGPVVAEGAHHPLVDVVAARLQAWLVSSHEQVIEVVARQAPGWSPRFIDRRVGERVHAELLRVVTEVVEQPDHQLRRTLDDFLGRLAADLGHDTATMTKTDLLVRSLLARPDTNAALHDVVSAGRRLLVDLVEDPDSELRAAATSAVAEFGGRLVGDQALRGKLDGWLEQAATYVVTHYRDELTTVITDTVQRWDGEETARRIELQVGRDLQFIRVNGTLVGALAGVAIHAATALL